MGNNHTPHKNHFKGLVDGRQVIEIIPKANHDISEFISIEIITGGFLRLYDFSREIAE